MSETKFYSGHRQLILRSAETKDDRAYLRITLNICKPHLGSNEFAPPDPSKELPCKGRRCTSCGKCRDWYFTGDSSTLQWIRSVKQWDSSDWKRWSDDRIHDQFKHRTDGSKCYVHADSLRDRLHNLFHPNHHVDNFSFPSAFIHHFLLWSHIPDDGVYSLPHLPCLCDNNKKIE